MDLTPIISSLIGLAVGVVILLFKDAFGPKMPEWPPYPAIANVQPPSVAELKEPQ